MNITDQQLEQGGLNIYTTLDPRAQKAAEEAVSEGMDSKSELETALVSIDPRNGHIKAMVGGKNYRENQYNHALAKTRQPGSSFKPIMYLTAIASKEMTSTSVFNSQPTLFHYDNNRKTYQPSNFGDKYLGEIPMREAIAASDNIYAVNTIMKIGPDKVADMAKKWASRVRWSLSLRWPWAPRPSARWKWPPLMPSWLTAASESPLSPC